MIRFSKKGVMDRSMEERCEKGKKDTTGLQFYTIEVKKETIYVIDDSLVPYKHRLEVIKLMYLKSIKDE